MIIHDEPLLATFRQQTHCELCGDELRHPAEPHHLHTRGAGGGSRLDVPINLIALGGFLDCRCHLRCTDGVIPRKCVLAVVADREGVQPEAITEEIDRLLRADKGGREPVRRLKG